MALVVACNWPSQYLEKLDRMMQPCKSCVRMKTLSSSCITLGVCTMHNPCKLMIMMYLLLVSSCMPDAHMTLGDIAQRMYTQRMYTQRMYAYAPGFLLSCVLV